MPDAAKKRAVELIRVELVGLFENLRRDHRRACELLAKVKSEKLWKDGYRNFSDFAENGVGVSRMTAYNMIHAAERLTAEQAAKYSPAMQYAISSAEDPDIRTKLEELAAKGASVGDVRLVSADARGKARPDKRKPRQQIYNDGPELRVVDSRELDKAGGLVRMGTYVSGAYSSREVAVKKTEIEAYRQASIEAIERARREIVGNTGQIDMDDLDGILSAVIVLQVGKIEIEVERKMLRYIVK